MSQMAAGDGFADIIGRYLCMGRVSCNEIDARLYCCRVVGVSGLSNGPSHPARASRGLLDSSWLVSL